ncbi:MAG: hypothetical protein GYB55_01665 [Cytophagales bacterium]|uniref:hypothetical protein n=1 Tax=Cyclobacterium marinum TaxID=104 RepID=UPI0011ECA3D3|nr:hypothetical protein [Cyclobacterium marinum]MBI0400354.1 hypothetical protein [Cyclobacterium marinum]MBR9773763.1 hypothetical protein [Cytophagales bacterium]
MNRLIVLVDFSPYTPTQLKLACRWQEIYGLDLVFLHKMDGLAPTLSNTRESDKIIAFNKAEAERKYLQYLKDSELSPISNQTTFEAIPLQLTHYLEGFLKPDDLLLLGLKGTGFLKRILIGSTATTIINQLNQTVIALPQSIDFAIPRKLVLSCQEKYPLNESALEIILNTVGKKIEEIELLTIIEDKAELEPSKTYLEYIESKIGEAYSYKISIYENTDAFSEIKKRFSQCLDDFIVLQKGSRHLNDKLFRRFFINDLIHDGNTPLIILPAEK